MDGAVENARAATIWALADRGLKPAQIVAETGFARSSVYRHLQVRPGAEIQPVEWTSERLERLARIYQGAIGVMAEAFGCSAVELLGAIGRLDGATTEPAIVAERVATPDTPVPASTIAETPTPALPTGEREKEEVAAPAIEVVVAAPAPAPAPAPVPASVGTSAPVPARQAAAKKEAVAGVRQYNFVDADLQLLDRRGVGFTDDPALAWSGTAEQARAARPTLKLAKFCKTQMVR